MCDWFVHKLFIEHVSWDTVAATYKYFSEHRSLPSLHSIKAKNNYTMFKKKNSKREADHAEHALPEMAFE